MNNKILVARSSMPLLDEYVDKIKDIWENRWLTNEGKFHQELEEKLKKYLDISNISLFTNGHMALEVGIESMNLTGEVITTPFTYASTIHAIVRNGLTPVFCDINKDDYTIDVNKIEELITDKTSAIIPVHVYGNICNVDEIGTNAKMSEFQSAMGLCNLEIIDDEIKKRKKVVERYRENLKNINGIKINEEQEGLKSNYAYFPVLFNKDEFGFNRDDVCDELSNNNIFARKYFYPLTSSFQCYEGKFKINETPVAKYVSENILTLPLYADLSLEEVDKICNIIKSMKK